MTGGSLHSAHVQVHCTVRMCHHYSAAMHKRAYVVTSSSASSLTRRFLVLEVTMYSYPSTGALSLHNTLHGFHALPDWLVGAIQTT